MHPKFTICIFFITFLTITLHNDNAPLSMLTKGVKNVQKQNYCALIFTKNGNNEVIIPLVTILFVILMKIVRCLKRLR